MSTIPQPRVAKLPRKASKPYVALETMLAGAGTFYQICERAAFDIEKKGAEPRLRAVFADLVDTGLARVDDITFSISARARVALTVMAPTDYVGQVAAPHFRGVYTPPSVRIVSRPPHHKQKSKFKPGSAAA